MSPLSFPLAGKLHEPNLTRGEVEQRWREVFERIRGPIRLLIEVRE